MSEKRVLMLYLPTQARQLLEYIDAKECMQNFPDDWEICEDQTIGEYTPPSKYRRLR